MTDFSPDAARSLAGPSWLVERRLAAAESFAAAAMPDTSSDEWRYSPIGALELAAFAPASGLGDAPMPRLDIEPAAMVRTVNGRIVAIDIDDELVASGVHVGPLTDHRDGAELLGSVVNHTRDHFSDLNDAFAGEPVLVRIPDGVVVDRPIVVTHHSAGEGAAAFPRLFVSVGDNAQVEVLDHHTSDADDRILVAPVVELDVATSGRLGYLNVQELGRNTWQIASHLARAERDATITAATAAFGGSYARTRSDTRLVGRGAHGDLLALYFAEAEQTLDFRTYQDHAASDTTSKLLYKGAVADDARSISTGLMHVAPDARGTSASQTNRNLKLSDRAWADAVPNLEVENDDVRCTQAATVSPIDKDQRFYLESRGVPSADAERLIVAGFFVDVIESMPVAAAGHKIRSAVAGKLARQAEPEAEAA